QNNAPRRQTPGGGGFPPTPRPDSRVNPAMVCSIPPTSRASIGVNSTPSDGATAWIAANWAVPEVMEGSRMTAARVIAGAICLSSSSHFPLVPYSTKENPVVLPPWTLEGCNLASPDRVADTHKNDRHSACYALQCCQR